MEDWESVVAHARTLPGVIMDSYYGSPVPKHNGKALVAPGREPDSFVMMIGAEEKAMLIETDPDTFWETDHYRGWPGLLVRYGCYPDLNRAEPERECAAVMLYQHSEKTLHGAEYGPVDHNRPVPGVILPDIGHTEPFGKVKIYLNC